MHRHRLHACVLAILLTSLAPAPARAQDHDPDHDEWLADCRRDDHGWRRRGRRYRHCEVRESAMAVQGGVLRVNPGRNGGVAIRAWEHDSVHIVTKIQTQGRTTADAEALAGDVRVVAAGGTIRAEGPGTDDDRFWSVSFDVYVPRETDLNIATENGPLAVKGVTGEMTLSAHNGPVALHGVSGDVRARVRNGPLSVVLGGSGWDGPGLDAETVNGPVVLSIPENYSARLETGTVNGPMSVDFPLTVTVQGRLTQRINATLGQGGAPVRVVTTNGPLVIKRRGGI